MSRDIHVPSLLAALRIPIVRKAGEAYWCCCPSPDHTERTPSWFMRERPGDRFHASFHCFGCEFAGWPVQLVQKMLGLKTQAEAFNWLRDMPVVEQPIPSSIEVVILPTKTALQVPPEVEFAPFDQWPARYRDYLTGRSVVEQATAWGLGYVPTNAIGADGEPSALAGRVWIPAHDAGGRLLSYTARAIGHAKRRYREPYTKENASPAAIFGELRWPVLERQHVVVVEGAFNAMAVERVAPGVAVAALMGSSLDPQQVLKLIRFGTVLLAFDPDKAGNKVRAQLRGQLARYVKTRDVMMPAGQDCDSLPAEQLRALVDQALA